MSEWGGGVDPADKERKAYQKFLKSQKKHAAKIAKEVRKRNRAAAKKRKKEQGN